MDIRNEVAEKGQRNSSSPDDKLHVLPDCEIKELTKERLEFAAALPGFLWLRLFFTYYSSFMR